MPSSFVRTFSEPDDYAPVGQHSHTRLLAIKRPVDFTASFTAIELPNIRINHFSDTLPRIGRVGLLGDRILFGFVTHPMAGPITNGLELGKNSIHRTRAVGQEFYHQTTDVSSYVTLSLAPDALTSFDELARHVPTTNDILKHTPPAAALAKLRRLFASAKVLADEAPIVLTSLEAGRSLEQAFLGIMVACFCGEDAREDTTAKRRHAAIMRRFYRVIEERPDEPVYVPELCKAVGVSERTLRTCCEEHLGMGPKQFLVLRRLNLVRRALRESSPAETSVTNTATRYGFWQFGRLAVEYKALFGESPSATLGRPPAN
jgi:AraC-like DNA-binding protein